MVNHCASPRQNDGISGACLLLLSFDSGSPVAWVCLESESHSVVSDSFATPWTVACQAPLSMEFSRPGYWSG